MKVLIPGHLYELTNLDNHEPGNATERLRFVTRVGDKYPGNAPPATSGTITQEVLRVLIDRTEYVNGQREHARNGDVLYHLRQALRQLEMRAAEERGDKLAEFRIVMAGKPELMPACERCGHVECHREPCR